MTAFEKFQIKLSEAENTTLLMFPSARAYIKQMIEQEEKRAREKARGMTDEEWKQCSQPLAYAADNVNKDFGEMRREIQLLANALIPKKYIALRSKFSKKRGRQTTR